MPWYFSGYLSALSFQYSDERYEEFRDVKSVYYNGAKKGVADIVLGRDPTTLTMIATYKIKIKID
jgi:hypothetical protein